MRKALVALAVPVILALAGCGGISATGGSVADSSPATWPGSAADAGNGDSVTIGEWKGKPGAIEVTCSGQNGQVTAVSEAPEGWTATTTQPKGGGDAGVKIEGQGKAVEVQPHGDASVRWGVTATFSTGFSLEDPTGLKFYARAVSCER